MLQSESCQEASPQHDTAPTMLRSGDGVFVMMCSVWCPPNIVCSVMAKNLYFGLIKPATSS